MLMFNYSVHFLASCKNPVDNIWYRFNDAMVERINNIQKDILNFQNPYINPYILFYQRNKNDDGN